MQDKTSQWLPALVLAAAVVAAAAWASLAPRSTWAAIGGPLLLILALLGTDLALRRRTGEGALPSPGVLLVAGAVLVAAILVGVRGVDRLAAMMPILGAAAASPLLLRRTGAGHPCGGA